MSSGVLHFSARALIAALATAASTQVMAVGVKTVNGTASAGAIVTTEVASGSGVLHTESLKFTPNLSSVTISHGEALIGSMKLDGDWVLDLGAVSVGSVLVDLGLAVRQPGPGPLLFDFSVSKFSYQFKNDGVAVGGFGGTGSRAMSLMDVTGPLSNSTQRGSFVFDEIVYSATVNVLARSANGIPTPTQTTIVPVGDVTLSWTAPAVPEAHTWALAAFGLTTLALFRRRQAKA